MAATDATLAAEWRALLARHARVNAALERELQHEHRLSVTEFEALSRLAEHQQDGCRLQYLVDDLHMSQSALSRLISRLHDVGLVERNACTEDRRGIYACITAAGRTRLTEAQRTHEAVLARTLHEA